MDRTLTRAEHFRHKSLPLDVRRVAVDATIAPHGHEFQEFVFVERGRSRHVVERLDARSRRRIAGPFATALLPGDCFVIGVDERHAYDGADDLVVYNVLFTPELLAGEQAWLQRAPGLGEFLFLEPLFRRESGAPDKLHLDVPEQARVRACLEAIARECADAAPGFELAARGRFLELLAHLGRAWQRARGGDGQRAPLAAGQRDAVERALAFIEERYGEEDLSLQAIAAAAFLSPHHFSELFKKRTGLSPWEYLTGLRLERAQAALAESDASVTEVALRVGFADSSYFARVFKAETGLTPRAWRAKHRAG